MPNSLRSEDKCKIDACFEAIKKVKCIKSQSLDRVNTSRSQEFL